ncbi:MAG TPA: hypothetical protein VHL58_20705, partial [Thermoanaerobaculia bacterium]|nr:hypothetical protein [Thermoanaerobaculia bacterium]
LEVAVPIRQRGIDLIAYSETTERGVPFVPCPIQLRASAGRTFSVDQAFASVPNLIFAFIWGIGTDKTTSYGLTYREAELVAESMGYTLTQSWQKDLYSLQQPNRSLLESLEKHLMTPALWRQKVIDLQSTFRERLSEAAAL